MHNGQLKLDFRGEAYACSVSAVVIYPRERPTQGQKFLDYVVAKRRFFFDNYFHRVLHKATGDPLAPPAAENQRGYVIFHARLHAGCVLQRHAAESRNRASR